MGVLCGRAADEIDLYTRGSYASKAVSRCWLTRLQCRQLANETVDLRSSHPSGSLFPHDQRQVHEIATSEQLDVVDQEGGGCLVVVVHHEDEES